MLIVMLHIGLSQVYVVGINMFHVGFCIWLLILPTIYILTLRHLSACFYKNKLDKCISILYI